MARRIINLEEIAERTRIPVGTLRHLRYTGGNMPITWKLNGRVVAFEHDVERWIEEQYASTATTPPAA